MLFVKKVFQRLLGKSPTRSKSEERSLCKSDQNSLLSNSTSKLSSSLEIPTGTRPKQLKTIGELTNDRYSLQSPQSVDRADVSKSHQLPGLISLADARKHLHEINNSGREHDDRAPKLKSYLLTSKQASRLDIKAPKNNRQVPDIRRKLRIQNKSSQLSTDRNTPTSNNLSWSKDLSKSKSNLSNSFEEKPWHSQLRAKPRSNDLRQPAREKGVSESPKIANNPAFKRVFPRSESYVQKNRQNLAKAVKSIELLENNVTQLKAQALSVSTKQRQPLRSNSSSRYISQPPSKPKQTPPTQVNPDLSKRSSYSRKERPRLLNLTPLKSRDETPTMTSKTQSTTRERTSSSMSKLKTEESVLQTNNKSAAWRRFEVKSREVQQNTSTFENELDKVDMLLQRNSNAMADLIAIRENLLEISFKEEMKVQKVQQRRPHRPIRVPQ